MDIIFFEKLTTFEKKKFSFEKKIPLKKIDFFLIIQKVGTNFGTNGWYQHQHSVEPCFEESFTHFFCPIIFVNLVQTDIFLNRHHKIRPCMSSGFGWKAERDFSFETFVIVFAIRVMVIVDNRSDVGQFCF